MKRLALILIFIGLSVVAFTQNKASGYTLPANIVNGDTVPVMVLDEVTISPPNTVTASIDPARYSKLARDVKKVYPFAVIAGIKLKEYNDMLDTIKDESVKKIKLKQAEEDLKNQFTDDIENMTHSQGVICLKLIYRQTGVTSYEIVKELRGSIRAVFWQTIARIFGNNLKVEYDPVGEDKAIEEIVKQIESGKL
jgi:hypothetical protein